MIKMGGGLWLLIKKLYYIKKTHQRTQRLYKDFIFLYPHLKYPALEQCSDYEEALKCKYHLSYLLGQALIKAHKSWYRGGYLKLKALIKDAKQYYKALKEFAQDSQFDIFSLSLIFENKDGFKLFYQEYKKELIDLLQHVSPKQKQEFIKLLFSLPNSHSLLKGFKELFEEFKDYEALLVVLKHNISFHLQSINDNLALIKEWLHSKEFKEKYFDTKHPYPSLLNPLKLDYESVDAALAWDMNVPLPDLYSFVHIGSHGVGVVALARQLYHCCNIFFRCSWVTSKINTPKNKYCTHFNDLRNNHKNTLIISFSEALYDRDFKKYLSLVINQNTRILYQVRDPISIIKHTYGRHYHWDIYKNLSHEFNLTFDYRCYINPFKNFKKKTFKDMDMRKLKISSFLFEFFQEKINLKKIYYLDMNEILPEKSFSTLQNLASIFDFEQPNDKNKDIIEVKEFRGFLRYILPLTLYADSNDVKNMFKLNNTNNKKNLNINKNAFKITLTRPNKDLQECCIVNELRENDLLKDIYIYMNKDEFELLKKNDILYKSLKEYLDEFLKDLEEANRYYEQELVSNEKDILDYLRKNSKERYELKSILDKELFHIKTHRPDIVASWSYYNEFEKICEELDKH